MRKRKKRARTRWLVSPASTHLLSAESKSKEVMKAQAADPGVVRLVGDDMAGQSGEHAFAVGGVEVEGGDEGEARAQAADPGVVRLVGDDIVFSVRFRLSHRAGKEKIMLNAYPFCTTSRSIARPR
jgi:hypothetical protein